MLNCYFGTLKDKKKSWQGKFLKIWDRENKNKVIVKHYVDLKTLQNPKFSSNLQVGVLSNFWIDLCDVKYDKNLLVVKKVIAHLGSKTFAIRVRKFCKFWVDSRKFMNAKIFFLIFRESHVRQFFHECENSLNNAKRLAFCFNYSNTNKKN